MQFWHLKKNVPWHILAPRRGCFCNHLPLRRVRIPAERFYFIGHIFLWSKKELRQKHRFLRSSFYVTHFYLCAKRAASRTSSPALRSQLNCLKYYYSGIKCLNFSVKSLFCKQILFLRILLKFLRMIAAIENQGNGFFPIFSGRILEKQLRQ